jgi:hydrogenase expression/formation protein HypE
MDRITLSHGSGGMAMHRLIDSLFMKEFANPILREKKDSAILRFGAGNLAFTTDSYVVKPIFFPGGDIGSLAVYGTVNDLNVCGARPLFISLGLIIEEGLERAVLEKVVRSIASAVKRAGVKIATGDTKVVEKGSCDGIFINTSGVGVVYRDGLSIDRIRPGDRVIVSGGIGEHAISVLSKREGIDFKSDIKSDSAPLNRLIRAVLAASREVRFMRDPTRGGVATTLNEIVDGRPFGIAVDEREIPLKDGVREACELMGLDPLYLACEGRALVVVGAGGAAKALGAMRADPLGRAARVIGRVVGEHKGRVFLETAIGTRRVVDMLTGEQLPRIC